MFIYTLPVIVLKKLQVINLRTPLLKGAVVRHSLKRQ